MESTPRILRILDKAMHELEIDPEFEAVNDPLEEESRNRLKGNIKRDGCTESLYTWNKVIVDGHNRYSICKELNIPFSVVEMEFSDREEAILWMIDRQLGRRNLSKFKQGELVLRYEKLYAKRARENQGARNDLEGNFAPNSERSCRTVKKMAERAGIGHDTMNRIRKLAEEADEDTKKQLREGKISVNKAYTDLDKKTHEGQMKVCERCGKEKPVLEFPRSRGGLFFLPVCKECSSVEAPTMSTQPESEPNKTTSVAGDVSSQTSLELTYDRFDAYPDATRLDHPIEVPNNVGESARTARPFTFVQGQVHFALKNMLKELKIGLNWLSEEDRSRIPELLGMLEEASDQAKQMIKQEMED